MKGPGQESNAGRNPTMLLIPCEVQLYFRAYAVVATVEKVVLSLCRCISSALLEARWGDHIIPVFQDFHYLPVSLRA